MQKALHQWEHLDVATLNQTAETDLKSVGHVLDEIQRADFESLGTNATALLKEIRQSNAKLENFIDDTDGTVKKMQLEKLTQDADALVVKLDDMAAKLEPGLTGVDFESFNQTLAGARQAINNMNDVLNELKRYPAGFIFGGPPSRPKEVQPGNK
jgi:hypothetical protein